MGLWGVATGGRRTARRDLDREASESSEGSRRRYDSPGSPSSGAARRFRRRRRTGVGSWRWVETQGREIRSPWCTPCKIKFLERPETREGERERRVLVEKLLGGPGPWTGPVEELLDIILATKLCKIKVGARFHHVIHRTRVLKFVDRFNLIVSRVGDRARI